MMQEETMGSLGKLGRRRVSMAIGFLAFAGVAAACAGAKTPDIDQDFKDQIAAMYADGETGVAGGGGTGSGTGGSTSSGAGGSGTGGSSMVGGSGAGGGSGAACSGFALINSKCGGGPCHGAPQAGTLTNFASDEPTAKSFAGVQDPSPLCMGGGILFNPDNPASSLVIQKMQGTASCGSQMPLGGPYLEDADIKCVEDWINTL